METKICTKCGEEKNIIYFAKDKRAKNGFRNQCKKCIKRRLYLLLHPPPNYLIPNIPFLICSLFGSYLTGLN